MTQTPAGWYPEGDSERFWDGSRWTDQRRAFQAVPGTPPQQYGGAPATYVQGPPPTKSHTARNILIIFGVLFVLFVGGCFAVIAVTANEVDNVIDDAIEADQQPGGPDSPLEITEGEAFEVNGFDYAAGWGVQGDSLGFIEITELKVTNNRDEADSAIVEIKFWSGTEVLAVDNCSTEQIAVGTTTQVSCIGLDTLPDSYDRITINDSF
jgi:hypothetical protein